MRSRLIPILSLASLFAAACAAAAPPEDVLREILVREQARTDADGYLVGLTADDRPDVRARAFLALGRLQDEALLPALAAGLGDDEVAVRAEAAFALGQLESAAAEPILTGALESETAPEVRARLVEAWGKCTPDTTSPAGLSGHLKDPDPGVARAAAVALGRMARRGVDISPAGRELDAALRSPDPELVWRSALAVSRGEFLPTAVGLRYAMRSDDPVVLLNAIRASAPLRNPWLRDELPEFLRHEDWRVRIETLRALVGTQDDHHIGLMSLLLSDPNENVRLATIDALGKFRSGVGLGRIMEFRYHEDWHYRAAYITAMAEGSGDGALPDMLEAVKDPDWRIRRAAAEAFAKVPTEQSLVIIEEELIQDESPQVVAALVAALTVFPQRHAVEVIRSTLGSTDAAVLVSAATAAGERHDLGAVSPLLTAYDRLLSPPDSEIMIAILDALGAILTTAPDDDPIGELSDADREQALTLLDGARRDPSRAVALAAANALERVQGEPVAALTPPTTEPPASFDLELALALETGRTQYAARLVTERGTFLVQLRGRDAPGTVANFVDLARSGYFNGLTFHRVVWDFVTQGGDPRGDGWGGPGYAIRCEYNPLSYGTGTVGMALAGKDTGGSQFFITHSPQPHLDGRYTIFGEVLEGMDVVSRILIGDVINEVVIEER